MLRSAPSRLFALALALGAGVTACSGEEGSASREALALSLARFAEREPGTKGAPVPLPAAVEFLVPDGDTWRVVLLEDAESNVFHKAMVYRGQDGRPELLTAAGSAASVKLWSQGPGGLTARTVWEKDFGGKFSRMRDLEVADLFGDGGSAVAVATHDQGVVAVLRPDDQGGFSVDEIDREANTFVHEIEVGDVDGDGVLEVYATPSEPNRLDGTPQSGVVVRYVPAKGEGRVVVADLGDRHAKEILVADVDGDGRDELYVAVEGKLDEETKALDKGVEIRRYDADTDPSEGIVVASIRDRLNRFLTVGDLDGDGAKELVAAAFHSGLWLLRPGADPQARWTITSIDRDSGGFEHAAITCDLDGDGTDELYVASDNHNEVRRYVWDAEQRKLAREVIYKRPGGGSVFTWNIMPVPIELTP
jgi:hypothetical protein